MHATARNLVLFGTSNLLSDIFDCAPALGLTSSRIVPNVAEERRERTRRTIPFVFDVPVWLRYAAFLA